MTRTYTPTTPLEKLLAAHELLADVAQVLAGDPDPRALVVSKVLAIQLEDMRLMVPVVQAVKP